MTKRLSTRVVLAAAAFMAVQPVHAQSRPDSLTMTCAAVQAAITRAGALVVGTGPYVFDRFVSDGRGCAVTQYARQGFIETKDVKYCLVYTCRERTLFWQP